MKIITQRGLNAQAVTLKGCVNDLQLILNGQHAGSAHETSAPVLSPARSAKSAAGNRSVRPSAQSADQGFFEDTPVVLPAANQPSNP